MRIAVINGSQRKHGNGSDFIQKIAEQLEKCADIEIQIIQLSDKNIGMCKGCLLC